VWLIGVASFLLAFLPIPPLRDLSAGPGELGCWLRRNGALLVGLALLVLFALLVRGYDLEHIPANLGGDEGTQGADALQLLRPALGNPFSTGWYSVPTMSFLAYGMSMEVFGATVSGLRALSAVVGAATVLTTFLLARELWGPRAAWLSGAALALSHYHIHFSRLGSNQIADGLFITSSLWLLMRGLRTRRASTFAAAGAAVGLGWYGYFGARLVVVVVVCYLAWQAMVRHRFLDRYGHLLVIMVASAAVVAAPLLLHYVAHPGDLVSRPRQVSIFASEWLAREREVTGRSSVSLLFEQFWKSISAFNYTLDPTFWYRASIPLLDSVSGLFFILGMTWAMRRYRWPSSSLLVIWFWLALILGWVTTENPPSSQRMVIVAPALALFVGLGVDQLFRLLRRLLEGQQTVYLGLAMGLLVAVAGLNLRYYFLVYTPTRVYGNPTAEMTTVLARQLEERGGDHVVYFHGPPYVYWDFGTLRFMARDVMGIDVPPPQEGEAPQPDLGRGARFVLHPRRLDELEGIQARYPGGRTEYVHSTADGELLYAMYEVRR
jgi:predicted membrane-bound mannosyltransferase